MRLSDHGVALLKSFESLELIPYKDTGGVRTIGYGHKILPSENFSSISKEEAEALLRQDVARTEAAVDQLTSKLHLTQNQFDALVSFAFNVGTEAFRGSTLLRLLRLGDNVGAANQFKRWSYDNGKWVKGLNNRRIAEANLFLS